MLSEDLNTMLSLELSNKSRIPMQLLVLTRASQMSSNKPKITCNTKVFATAHESVSLTSLSRRWNTRRIKILLFASCYSDQTVECLVNYEGFRSRNLPS